ncbi:hypothetical protein [Lysobacter sp. CA199]|uniref:hypothetical protein n=1 Tax=Lysobacter sp. CA199 TaxID=3455608 RepID=UPI003F8D4287
MDLETIGTVQEIDSVQEVNRLLEEGWVILAIATGKHNEGEPWIRYSLGLEYEDEEEDEDEEGEAEE